MSKKRHYNEAERLFICDGLSADEIQENLKFHAEQFFIGKKNITGTKNGRIICSTIQEWGLK